MRVKIGDFGLAKMVGDGTAFRTEGGTRSYVAPEMGIDTGGDTSEYTNAVDIWAIGCIAHELLTRFPPFKGFGELMSYCYRPEFPRKTMLSRNISQKGIEFVESTLAYPPERRIAAKEALDSEWLRLECGEAVGQKRGENPAVPEGSTPILPAAIEKRKDDEEGGKQQAAGIEALIRNTAIPETKHRDAEAFFLIERELEQIEKYEALKKEHEEVERELAETTAALARLCRTELGILA